MTESKWKICLLDSFRIERNGRVVQHLGDRKWELVLAYLGLHATTPVARLAVIEALWPDRSTQLGRSRLTETLCILRKQLRDMGMPADAIVGDRRIIQLNPSVHTDVDLYRDSVAVALAQQEDPVERARHLGAAAAMYGGGLLPAVTEPWAQSAREELAAMHEGAVGQLRTTLATIDAVSAGTLAGDVPANLLVAIQTPFGAPPIQMPRAPTTPPRPRPITEVLEELPRRHVERCVALAEEAEPHLLGPNRQRWLGILDGEYGRLKTALDWVIEHGDGEHALRIAGALWVYWHVRSLADEGRLYLERVLAIGGAAPGAAVKAKCLNGAGVLAVIDGDLVVGQHRLEEALEIWMAADDEVWVARTLSGLGIVAYKEGDYDAARRRYAEAIRILQRRDRLDLLSSVLHDAGIAEKDAGEYDEAERLFRLRLDVCQQSGDDGGVAGSLAGLGTIAQHRGDYVAAESLCESALRMYESAGDLQGVGFTSLALGYSRYRAGDLAGAERFYEASLETARIRGHLREVGEASRYLASLAAEHGDLERATSLYLQALHALRGTSDAAGISKVEEALAELINANDAQARGTD